MVKKSLEENRRQPMNGQKQGENEHGVRSALGSPRSSKRAPFSERSISGHDSVISPPGRTYFGDHAPPKDGNDGVIEVWNSSITESIAHRVIHDAPAQEDYLVACPPRS
jgi:hypothetical protein